MPRLLISRLMVVTLLFMSLEGAIDSVVAGGYAGLEGGYSVQLDDDSDVAGHDASQSGDHCEHCCHGHTSCLSATNYLIAHMELITPVSHRPVKVPYFSLAPPTPPPNA